MIVDRCAKSTAESMEPSAALHVATGSSQPGRGRGRPKGVKNGRRQLDDPNLPLAKRLAILQQHEEAKGKRSASDAERRRMVRVGAKMSELGLEMVRDLVSSGATITFPSTMGRGQAQACRDRLARIADLAAQISTMPAFRKLKLATDPAVEDHAFGAQFAVCHTFTESDCGVAFELHGNTVTTSQSDLPIPQYDPPCGPSSSYHTTPSPASTTPLPSYPQIDAGFPWDVPSFDPHVARSEPLNEYHLYRNFP